MPLMAYEGAMFHQDRDAQVQRAGLPMIEMSLGGSIPTS